MGTETLYNNYMLRITCSITLKELMTSETSSELPPAITNHVIELGTMLLAAVVMATKPLEDRITELETKLNVLMEEFSIAARSAA